VKKKEVTTQQMFLPWPEQKEIPSGEGWSVVRCAEGFSLVAVLIHRDPHGAITKYFKHVEKVLPVKAGKKKSASQKVQRKTKRSKKNE
jgi:hypothetical protein